MAVRYVFAIYQQWELLVIAYAIIFFPLSLVAVRASMSSAPVGLEEVGTSLGRSRLTVMARVTVPLLAPGLAAAFCLVFLSAITELTATLLLIPTGAHTLATQFWSFQNDASDSAAAPYAAVDDGHRPGARRGHRPLVQSAPVPSRGVDMSGVNVSGLAKAFGGHTVLDRLDLTVPTGSLTAVLGPSGSGKTTLLRILAGFEPADAGSITIGADLVDGGDGRRFVPPKRRRIGYVPQEGALFPHLTVAKNIGFGIRRGPGRARRVTELIDLVGLTGLDNRLPHQLSGDSNNGSRWPGRSPSGRPWCCWTSHSRRSTQACDPASVATSGGFSRRPVPLLCW